MDGVVVKWRVIRGGQRQRRRWRSLRKTSREKEKDEGERRGKHKKK